MICDHSTLAFAGIVPLRTGESEWIGNTDRFYDSQLAIQYNWIW